MYVVVKRSIFVNVRLSNEKKTIGFTTLLNRCSISFPYFWHHEMDSPIFMYGSLWFHVCNEYITLFSLLSTHHFWCFFSLIRFSYDSVLTVFVFTFVNESCKFVKECGLNRFNKQTALPFLLPLLFLIPSIILPLKDDLQWVTSNSRYCTCLSRQVYVL